MLDINLKKPSLIEPYDYITRKDPDLDTEAEDFEKRWQLYLDGQGDPPLKAKGKPTLFRMRPLDGDERAHVMDLIGQDKHVTAHRVACGLGLLWIQQGDDKLDAPRIRRGGFSQVDPDWLGRLPDHIVIELGSVAFARSQLSPS